MNDLSFFSNEELTELRESAIENLKILKMQIAGIPQANVPALNLIQINDLQNKVSSYQKELQRRTQIEIPTKNIDVFQDNIREEIRKLIQQGKTKQALEVLQASPKASAEAESKDQVSLLMARLKTVELQQDQKVINNHDYLVQIAQINRAILNFIGN